MRPLLSFPKGGRIRGGPIYIGMPCVGDADGWGVGANGAKIAPINIIIFFGILDLSDSGKSGFLYFFSFCQWEGGIGDIHVDCR